MEIKITNRKKIEEQIKSIRCDLDKLEAALFDSKPFDEKVIEDIQLYNDVRRNLSWKNLHIKTSIVGATEVDLTIY